MKRFTTIVLLGLHLFYSGGYMLLFYFLIYQSDRFVEQQISKGYYNVRDLVEIKIPVHIPYGQNWIGYQPVSGQVQLQQGCYNYVKLKITNDTLYVMCVPNYRTTKLIQSNIIYARQISDFPLTKKGSASLKQLNIDQYNFNVVNYEIKPVVTQLETEYNKLFQFLPDAKAGSLDPPPRAA